MPLDKYELPADATFAGSPDREPSASRGFDTSLDEAHRAHGAPKPVLRRFPPVLQFVTRQRSDLTAELERLVRQGYERGLNLNEIRGELVSYAASKGFSAFIRVHEVRTEDMPSFPEQTILTGMFLVDMRPGPATPEFRYPA